MAGLSKLAAVNIALQNIGESPVATLEGSGDALVATAINTLEETVRAVLSEGWEFNTDSEMQFSPDVSGNVVINDSWLRVDGTYRSDDLTVRQGKLYNKTEQTFVFTDAVKLDIVWEFEWDDLPQYIRQYIAVRSARVFSRRALGDHISEQLTVDDEVHARAAAKRAELTNADVTIFDNYRIGRMLNRRIY